MIHAAVFGTEKVITSRFGCFEPFGGVFAGHDVGLDTKGGYEHVVNHILAGHDQFDLATNRNMQLIDFALTSRMLELPHPLFADNVNFQSVLWWTILGKVNLRSPNEDAHRNDQGNDRPERL